MNMDRNTRSLSVDEVVAALHRSIDSAFFKVEKQFRGRLENGSDLTREERAQLLQDLQTEQYKSGQRLLHRTLAAIEADNSHADSHSDGIHRGWFLIHKQSEQTHVLKK